MRIGIITLWQSSDNYGQQLQCWALQQQLLKMGHEPYLIRYDIDHRSGKKKQKSWKKVAKLAMLYPAVKALKTRIKRKQEKALLDYVALRNKERHFDDFRKTNLRLSARLYANLEELRNNPPQAEAYIVGSDQVWAHLLNNPENAAMYLDFGEKKTKRIAYAPSFSMPEYPQKLKDYLRNELAGFDALSVREQTGAAICQELGYKAEVVVDPTMLLDMKDYETIKDIQDDTSYIYLYYLNISNCEEVEWTQLKECAEKRNLRIVATPASGYFVGKELFKGVEYKYATIPQWIGVIDKARLVVTTSFHGVVICILHHTPFVYFPLMGKYSRGNNRVLDLCETLGLFNRIWQDASTYDALMSSDIDWNIVDEKLNVSRCVSIEFLNMALRK